MDTESPETDELPAVQWTWLFPLGVVLGLVAHVSDAMAAAWTELSVGVAAHILYRRDRERFRQEAAIELERLVGE